MLFSTMVREIAATMRGDVSGEIVPLRSMPSISIDLPKSKHGYDVQADEVFWVIQGILRSTDLRDSMDEQCIADIAACVIGNSLIERSKDALDSVYETGNPEQDRILSALEIYGSDKFKDEFKFCVDEIIRTCQTPNPENLRDIIFAKKTTNPFPSVFAAVLIAFHEIIIRESKQISSYDSLRALLTDLSVRMATGRKGISSDERRKNIDIIKGLIANCFVQSKDQVTKIYTNHTVIDVEAVIRRSEIELGSYELKQGCLALKQGGGIDYSIFNKVTKTICAIANNGPDSYGKIIVGITDSDSDAKRVKEIDSVEPRRLGKRYIVGVNREAKRLGITTEEYFSKWKNAIKDSKLSEPLKSSCLSGMDYNSYYGLGIIVISIPAQKELSYVGEDVFWRNGDSTEKATSPKKVAELAQRFSKS